MVGDIKTISPCVKSASAKLFLDLHTVLAPRDEERTLDTGRTRCAIFYFIKVKVNRLYTRHRPPHRLGDIR